MAYPKRVFTYRELNRMYHARLSGTPVHELAKAYRTSTKLINDQLAAWIAATGARKLVTRQEFSDALDKAAPRSIEAPAQNFLFRLTAPRKDG